VTDFLHNNAAKTIHMLWKNNQLLDSKTPINRKNIKYVGCFRFLLLIWGKLLTP